MRPRSSSALLTCLLLGALGAAGACASAGGSAVDARGTGTDGSTVDAAAADAEEPPADAPASPDGPVLDAPASPDAPSPPDARPPDASPPDARPPDAPPPPDATPVTHLVINEVDYDQDSTDTAEFVEIFNGTGASVDLTGYTLYLVNGSLSLVYATLALPSVTLTPGQYLVFGDSTVSVGAGAIFVDQGDTALIQNGDPDGLALVGPGGVVDVLSYGGSITNVTLGSLTGVSLVEGTATPLKDSTSAVRSLCRMPNGADSDNASVDWAQCSTPTPGAANAL